MMNIMEIQGYKAIIKKYNPEIDMLRGEFIGLNGEADFYATNTKNFHHKGEISLKVFFEICEEKGINSRTPTA